MEVKKLSDRRIPAKLEVIENLINAFKFFQVLKTAINLELFDWLEKTGASTSGEIAEGIRIQGHFMKGYLQSLVELGFLVQADKKYTNSSIASIFLVRNKDTYQGECLSLTGSSDWNDLLTVFRSSNQMLESSPTSEECEVKAGGIRELDKAIQCLSKPLIRSKRSVGF